MPAGAWLATTGATDQVKEGLFGEERLPHPAAPARLERTTLMAGSAKLRVSASIVATVGAAEGTLRAVGGLRDVVCDVHSPPPSPRSQAPQGASQG